MDCHTKFAVKQECDGGEDVGSLTEPLREEYIEILPKSRTKCGEVFLGDGGGFTLLCAICSSFFKNFESFGDHIHDIHLNPNSNIDCTCTEEIFVDIHNNPLGIAPVAGNWIAQKQVEPSNQLVQMKIEVTRMSPENELKQMHQDVDRQNETIVSINSTESADKNPPFICDLCDCTYMHYKSYLAHVSAHGVLTKTNRKKFTHHISNNAANGSRTTSPVCDTMTRPTDEESTQHSFNSESKITSVLDAQNINKKNQYVCKICEQQYKHKRSLLFHVRTNHGEEAMDTILQVAPDSPNRLGALSEDEYGISSMESDPEHRCDFCGSMYRSRNSLRVHIQHQHENASHVSVNQTVCKYCDKKFSSNDLLKTHIHNDHPSDKKFVCPHCPKTFKYSYNRRGHINTHIGKRPYKCPHCPQTFSCPSYRARHRQVHLETKGHCCSFCDKTFIFKSMCKRHEMTHTGEKPYQCEECGKSFSSSGKFADHQRRHKNIKNHKCDVCSKAFYSWSILRDHKRSHTLERPFTCNVCGQSFPRKRALRTHEQLHSDVKKYVCNTCGKAFAQHAGLYSHKKSHVEIK